MYVTKVDAKGNFRHFVNGNFNIVKSVRFDKESIVVIELMPGRNFSQKLRNLITEFLILKKNSEKT